MGRRRRGAPEWRAARGMIRFGRYQRRHLIHERSAAWTPRSRRSRWSTPTIVLSYAAAFFFVVVAIAAAYALFKAGGTLGRVDTVLDDVDKQAVPLMQKAGTTLDGVNANLGNVDQITKDVADITDKIDAMANAVEGAVSTPARKAASFSAGVQGAVSSFMRRDKGSARGRRRIGARVRGVDRPAAGGAESFVGRDAAARGPPPTSATPRPIRRRRRPHADAADRRGARRRSRGPGDRREGLSMGLSTKLIVSGAVAGVALAYYVRSRRARTGEGYLHIVRQLPGDALRWVDDTKVAGHEGPRRGQDRGPRTRRGVRPAAARRRRAARRLRSS